MSIPPKPKDCWPVKAAVVITQANQNVGMLLKELLRNFNWTVIQTTSSIRSGIENIHQGNASLIIVDDSQEYPAASILRCLLCDPVTSITPTLSFVANNNRSDRAALSNLGRPLLVEKPLTPNRFIPGFKTLLKVWSSGYYLAVRQAIDCIISGNEEAGLRILTRLSNTAKARALVAPALSFYCRANGNIKAAEKILLNALKSMPRNLGLILSLSDLYFHTAMPHTALRLIKGAVTTYGNTLSIMADKFQAEYMMQDVDGAIHALRDLQDRGYFPQEYQNFMAGLLYCEGRIAEFQKQIGSSARATRFKAAWDSQASGDDTRPSKAS